MVYFDSTGEPSVILLACSSAEIGSSSNSHPRTLTDLHFSPRTIHTNTVNPDRTISAFTNNFSSHIFNATDPPIVSSTKHISMKTLITMRKQALSTTLILTNNNPSVTFEDQTTTPDPINSTASMKSMDPGPNFHNLSSILSTTSEISRTTIQPTGNTLYLTSQPSGLTPYPSTSTSNVTSKTPGVTHVLTSSIQPVTSENLDLTHVSTTDIQPVTTETAGATHDPSSRTYSVTSETPGLTHVPTSSTKSVTSKTPDVTHIPTGSTQTGTTETQGVIHVPTISTQPVTSEIPGGTHVQTSSTHFVTSETPDVTHVPTSSTQSVTSETPYVTYVPISNIKTVTSETPVVTHVITSSTQPVTSDPQGFPHSHFELMALFYPDPPAPSNLKPRCSDYSGLPCSPDSKLMQPIFPGSSNPFHTNPRNHLYPMSVTPNIPGVANVPMSEVKTKCTPGDTSDSNCLPAFFPPSHFEMMAVSYPDPPAPSALEPLCSVYSGLPCSPDSELIQLILPGSSNPSDAKPMNHLRSKPVNSEPRHPFNPEMQDTLYPERLLPNKPFLPSSYSSELMQVNHLRPSHFTNTELTHPDYLGQPLPANYPELQSSLNRKFSLPINGPPFQSEILAPVHPKPSLFNADQRNHVNHGAPHQAHQYQPSIYYSLHQSSKLPHHGLNRLPQPRFSRPSYPLFSGQHQRLPGPPRPVLSGPPRYVFSVPDPQSRFVKPPYHFISEQAPQPSSRLVQHNSTVLVQRPSSRMPRRRPSGLAYPVFSRRHHRPFVSVPFQGRSFPPAFIRPPHRVKANLFERGTKH